RRYTAVAVTACLSTRAPPDPSVAPTPCVLIVARFERDPGAHEPAKPGPPAPTHPASSGSAARDAVKRDWLAAWCARGARRGGIRSCRQGRRRSAQVSRRHRGPGPTRGRGLNLQGGAATRIL